MACKHSAATFLRRLVQDRRPIPLAMSRISTGCGDAEGKFNRQIWQDSVMYPDPLQPKKPNEIPLTAVAHLGMRGMHGASEVGPKPRQP